MNDFIAGPASGARQGGDRPGGGGAPPTVLIAALGAAVVIAATLVGFLLGSGAGDSGTARLGGGTPGPAVTTGEDSARVLLTVQLDGAGSGRVLVDPPGSTCTDTCERAFVIGTRVTLTPDADTDSKFEGWSDSCSGKDRCSVVMDRPREVMVTFESAPSTSTSPPDKRPPRVTDCHDGRDNDGDGLVDAAQDPNCANGGMEAGSAAASKTTTTTPMPPPPPPSASQCSDGRDNDGDGLIDRGDPGCAAGSTEGGTGGSQPASECRDGRDNDGDGLVDRPADPGCDADGTEAGG